MNEVSKIKDNRTIEMKSNASTYRRNSQKPDDDGLARKNRMLDHVIKKPGEAFATFFQEVLIGSHVVAID